jgi:isopenicillin-N epimerase
MTLNRRSNSIITRFGSSDSAAPIWGAGTPAERGPLSMPSRRSFVASLVGAGLALPSFREDAIAQVRRAYDRAGTADAAALAQDEAYWAEIQRAFDADRTMVNLNNGGVSPTPTHVLEAMIRDLRFSNELPVYHMWQVLEPRIESVRRDLARDFGCDPEELAITRNASEAMETMILGIDLQPGDEVIVTNQNYGRMLTTWRQRVRRDGIVLKEISFEVPPRSQAYLVERFREAITPRTRVIEVTHITNLTGQIMPVRELVDLARPLGITVFVDGAHAYAHFPFRRDDLGCDYYGTSLHKWLLAPIGTGFLYVRKEQQKALWPLMAAAESQDEDIRKYEEIGTHPAANHNAIGAALAFHRAIGAERKVARLRFLRDRWAKRLLAESDRVRVLTPLDSPYAGAIGLFHVEGIETNKLMAWLMERYRIVTTPINHPEFHGLRITPNVYTTLDEVDLFAEKVLEAIRRGIA